MRIKQNYTNILYKYDEYR